MGIKNVGLVYAQWGQLNDRPFRLLAYMAMTALDRDDPPRYFGGWESLALSGLGRDAEAAEPAEREAIKKAVQRTVSDLRQAHAITLLNTPKIGSRAVYSLNINRTRGGHSPSPTTTPEGDTNRPPQGDTHRPPRGVHLLTEEGDTHRPPKEEPHEAQQEGHHEEQLPKVTNISARAAQARAAISAARTAG